ncbi:RagB/SusD family nutrient uptake outer membrane protein [Niabella sp. CC-SYL272]|uniref:RagB/SusD family nutrient uptake outer membrane protein n=1 Tax=Niabella agricola TaxID=2891571 RepID=UPI001F1A76F4|nr:RagB/SusD family nutrient uptake outer membrane protein [Niabella agricola]MCF3107713.1 RagB/SusD family nutrient uptake outer membrane protein [Niabella agricola]
MKKYIKTICCIGAITVLAALGSCKKYLDREPGSIISSDEAFKNFSNFQGFTEELYQCIPDFTNAYWTNSWNWGEDEIQSTAQSFHFIVKVDNGDFWGWQRGFDSWGAGFMDGYSWNTGNDRMTKKLWPLAWYGIRKCNLGLENMDKLTDATPEERDLIKGQLLFFRGWFHFMLIQYFGGLPYIDKVLPSDEKLMLPRLKYQECADKAAADFRAAADLLPLNWDNTVAGQRTAGKNQLRINRIMALGYLGKNYLWAGSPLMNGESTGNASYNTEYCKKAAAAFGELLNYTESGQVKNGSQTYGLLAFSNYYKNFYTNFENWAMPGTGVGLNNAAAIEAIFRGPYWSANSSNYGTSRQYQPQFLIGEGEVKFFPTANYVNYYGMANGLPINPANSASVADAASGYDPQYPWKGRDPRFYNDIIYDGCKMVEAGIPNPSEEKYRYATLYTGGDYRVPITTSSRTGYLLFKFIPRTGNKYDLGTSYNKSLNVHLPYMRLADVYLMYAEAASEGYNAPTGKDPSFNKTAVDAINVIRDRAGVGHVAAQFLASQDAFRNEYRRERAVELSFEGHRFNDLRRWRLLIQRPYTLKTSLEFDRSGTFSTSNSKNNKVANLREQVILERQFSEKHYWLPLRNVDVMLYAEFPQNPGW